MNDGMVCVVGKMNTQLGTRSVHFIGCVGRIRYSNRRHYVCIYMCVKGCD